MRGGWGILLVGMLAAGAAHAERSVYKCTKPDGSVVFAAAPCGKDAKEVDTSGALRHGTAPNLQGVSDRAAMAAIDGDCQRRSLAIEDRYRSEIDGASREMDQLRREMNYSNNNFAGATRSNGIREQITADEDRRAASQRSEREEQAALAKECDEERRAELKRQADRDAKEAVVAQ
jgi:hypothetical protein